MMKISHSLTRELQLNLAKTINEHAEELTSLDRAIGDGDHGINMKRGFNAIVKDLDEADKRELGEIIKANGMTLVMNVGGASGPLFGTLLLSLGKSMHGNDLDLATFSAYLDEAVQAVMKRGKSTAGQKTMLDVLVPIVTYLKNEDAVSIDGVINVAAKAAQDTIPMQAIKGRASFLGERSIGHMDPGAYSVQLMATSVCNTLRDYQ